MSHETLGRTGREQSAAGTELVNRRLHERSAPSWWARLTPMGRRAAIEGEVANVGEGGAHLIVSAEADVTVGQRFEFELGQLIGSEPGASLLPEAAYVTVVRTEPNPGSRSGFVGVGLRFDQPLFIEPNPPRA